MTVLRDLRMRQAAHQLTSGTLTLDQIAGHTGYESRRSFVRAFRKAYGSAPTEYGDRLSQRPDRIPLPSGESKPKAGSRS
jgi:AraC-like DNA-binding protein